MSYNVFYPDDLAYRGLETRLVLGHQDNEGNFVVIALVPRDFIDGSIDDSVVVDVDGIKIYVIGTVNCQILGKFEFSFVSELQYPAVTMVRHLGGFVNLIVFKSPNSLHMEFYSLKSILLRGLPSSDEKQRLEAKLEYHLNTEDDMVNRHGKNFSQMLFVINSIDYLKYKLLNQNVEDPKGDSVIATTGIRSVFNAIISFFILICQMISLVLNFELLPNLRLTRISSMFYQLDTRLSLIRRIPEQLSQVKQKTASLQMTPSLPNYRASLLYITLYNLIYVIIIDLLLGNLMRNFIEQNLNSIVKLLQCITFDILYKDFRELICWLMNNPGGFKLNPELSTFIGQLYLWALDFWYLQIVNKLSHWQIEAGARLLLHMSEIFGATFLLSTMCDMIGFWQMHIASFNMSMTRIFNWQLNILKSLFKLFYGKKYNVLRDRIDSQCYTFDELLLGIIIFTVLVYLLPTVLAFYISFKMLHLGFYILTFCLQMTILALNELPIFIILLSLKNPKRLSDGIQLQMLPICNNENQIVIKMNSKSLSLFKLLQYYWKLINMNVELISLKQILIAVLGGELISTVDYELIYDSFRSI